MNCIIMCDWHRLVDNAVPNIVGTPYNDIWLLTRYGDIYKARVFRGENSNPGRVGLCTVRTDPDIDNGDFGTGAYEWFDWNDLADYDFTCWTYWSNPGLAKSYGEAQEAIEEIFEEDDDHD